MSLSTRDALELFGMPILDMPIVKLRVIIEEGKEFKDDGVFIISIIGAFPILSIFRGFIGLVSENTGDLLAVVDTDENIFYQINDSQLLFPDDIVFYLLDKTIVN